MNIQLYINWFQQHSYSLGPRRVRRLAQGNFDTVDCGWIAHPCGFALSSGDFLTSELNWDHASALNEA